MALKKVKPGDTVVWKSKFYGPFNYVISNIRNGNGSSGTMVGYLNGREIKVYFEPSDLKLMKRTKLSSLQKYLAKVAKNIRKRAKYYK